MIPMIVAMVKRNVRGQSGGVLEEGPNRESLETKIDFATRPNEKVHLRYIISQTQKLITPVSLTFEGTSVRTPINYEEIFSISRSIDRTLRGVLYHPSLSNLCTHHSIAARWEPLDWSYVDEMNQFFPSSLFAQCDAVHFVDLYSDEQFANN